jgi:hypothetical protein
MADCGCIKIFWTPLDKQLTGGSGDYFPSGEYNGSSYYEFIADGVTYYVFFKSEGGSNFWFISPSLGGDAYAYLSITDEEFCPINQDWISLTLDYDVQMTECDNPLLDCCMSVSMVVTSEKGTSSHQFLADSNTASGIFNGSLYWLWCIDDNGYQLFKEIDEHGRCVWIMTETDACGDALGSGEPSWKLDTCGCPVAEGWMNIGFIFKKVQFFSTGPCVTPPCVPIEDRDFRVYESIKLPMVFTEQNRGFKICCDPLMVLAGGETESWKNDVSSAWIKVSDPSDLFEFILEKDGVPVTSYALTVEEFPNEENAYYTTIQWRDVLALEGAGCYELKITYNISGLEGAYSWAKYNLMPYSIQNALKTARIRVKFNLKQEIEGINFTGANVEDSFRFWGFIGDRQVNTEIDNLVYQDRSVKTVVRENLDTYIISTDPLQECFITPLTDLYLLSENEMWISDYNAHNHSYKINDVPVVVQEAPEIDYLDRWQRRAVLTCTVGIRNKTKRTHY